MRPDAASAGVRDVTVAVHRCVTSPSDDLGRCYICMRRRDISLCMRHYCVYIHPAPIVASVDHYCMDVILIGIITRFDRFFIALGKSRSIAGCRNVKLDSPVKKISRLDELLRPIETVWLRPGVRDSGMLLPHVVSLALRAEWFYWLYVYNRCVRINDIRSNVLHADIADARGLCF